MSEIEMEPKGRRNPWIWVAAAVLAVILAVGAWALITRTNGEFDTTPAAEQPGTQYESQPRTDDPYGERPGATDPYEPQSPDPLETPEETRRP